MSDCREVGFVAIFEIKSGNEEQFEDGALHLASAVNQLEPGVIYYAPYRGPDGRYYFMERYKDLDARNAHATHPSIPQIFESIAPLLAAPPVVEPVELLCD
tara:strand:- start:284 stop:586 length:303 start_codon:yes stop_codon:yes gene_type:complete